MFEEVRKELLGTHNSDMESNSNDMSDFGNNTASSICGEGNEGINCSDCSDGASSGIGDGGGCGNDAGAGMSM